MEAAEGTVELLEELAESNGVSFHGVAEPLEDTFELRKPMVGVYRAWLPNADEGWLRMVLDQYGFEYVNLYPEDIREGGLIDRVDVVVIPDLNRDAVMEGMMGLSPNLEEV